MLVVRKWPLCIWHLFICKEGMSLAPCGAMPACSQETMPPCLNSDVSLSARKALWCHASSQETTLPCLNYTRTQLWTRAGLSCSELGSLSPQLVLWTRSLWFCSQQLLNEQAAELAHRLFLHSLAPHQRISLVLMVAVLLAFAGRSAWDEQYKAPPPPPPPPPDWGFFGHCEPVWPNGKALGW